MNSDIVLMKPAHSVSYFMFDNVWHFIKSIIFRLDVKYITYLFPHSIAFHSDK